MAREKEKQHLEDIQPVDSSFQDVSNIPSWADSNLDTTIQETNQRITELTEKIIRREETTKNTIINEPEKDIIVTWKISGKITGKRIKAWQAHHAKIQGEIIFIEKEIIGTEEFIIPKLQILNSGKKTNQTSLSAPKIIVGAKKEESGIGQSVIFNTENITFNNTLFLGTTTINLGEEYFQTLYQNQKEPEKYLKKIKILTRDIRWDIEDIQIRMQRPINKQYWTLFQAFIKAIQDLPDSKESVNTLWIELLSHLWVRIYWEVLKRLENLANTIKNLNETQTLLQKTYKKIQEITLTFKIRKIKQWAKIIIHYWKEKFELKWPMENQEITWKFELNKDPETNWINIEFKTEQKPLNLDPHLHLYTEETSE